MKKLSGKFQSILGGISAIVCFVAMMSMIMIEPEYKNSFGPVYIDVKECGAVGNGSVDDWAAFQKAVDSGIKTWKRVYVPPGKYKLGKTVIIANKLSNGNYAQAFIQIFGDDTKHSPGITMLQPTFKDGPVFAVHLNKGSKITGLFFDGKYRAPAISLDSLYRSPIDTYGDTTCRDSRYSPYTAIAIDPFRYNLPPDGGYPNLTSYYSGQTSVSGSTGLLIEDCTFKNFTIGAIVAPNGYTLNAEMITFRNIRVNDCKFAFVGCQAQEKDNVLESWEIWGKVRCAFVWGKYGQGQPGDYKINRVNIAGNVVQIFWRPSQGFFPLVVNGLYAENVRDVGYWNTSLNDEINNSSINLYYYKYINQFPDAHWTGDGVSINNTHIRYYGQFHVPLLMKGRRIQYINSPNAWNYVNPVKGLRYYYTDPDMNNGFFIDRIAFGYALPFYYEAGQRKLRLPRSNAAGIAVIKASMDSAKVGDFVIFYLSSNLDYVGMGEVVATDSAHVQIGYISAGVSSTLQVNVGIYRQDSNP